MSPAEVVRLIEGLKGVHGVRTVDFQGAPVWVAEDVGLMSRLAALCVVYWITANRGTKVRWDLARAPSQVRAWRELAMLWLEHLGDYKAESVCLVPFDEILGDRYKELERRELRRHLSEGVFPNELDIQAGDCSVSHAAQEAARLNAAIAEWMGSGVFAFAMAGLSQNANPNDVVLPSYDPTQYECHLAFDRPGLPFVQQPFKAIPMSIAGSGQQRREAVVGEDLVDQQVVTMTAWHLAVNTDALVFCLPNDRGLNLYQALYGDPQTAAGGLPAALVRNHPGFGGFSQHGLPKVVFCTTEQSFAQFEMAKRWHERHGTFLGA
jgi:hypothetical protein